MMNDYGLGFYCTEDIALAKKWACANQYEIDLSDCKVLALRGDKYSILNWLALLLKFRTFDVNTLISSQVKKYLLDNFYVGV